MNQAAVPLSRTKIIVPALRPEILHRQRLLSLLDELLEKKLVLISAPAGYGKTSLLVDMATSKPMPVCWFSVDALDQDPQRFLHYLIAAITQRFPKFGNRSRSALNGLTSLEGGLENLMVNLVNEIYERIDEHFVLVIDDYHFVDSVVDIRNFVSRFIRLVSENCHVVLSSRRLPALPDMTLLVAGDQVGGFSMEEMAFNTEEIRLLYKDIYQTGLSSEGLEKVVRLTEGWITGLQLTRPTPTGSLPDLSRSVRTTGVDLAHYFDEQVLGRQEPEVRTFLLRSSLLDEFDTKVCQAVLGELLPEEKPNWKKLIETVRRGNLFAQSIGPQGLWLRYHHLFQEFLRERIQEEDPELAWRILYQLAAYSREKNDWDKAHRIYRQMGDTGKLVSLLESCGSGLIAMDRNITLGEWLAELPDSVVEENPVLLSLRGMLFFKQGDLISSVGCFDRALAGMSEARDPYQLALTLARRAGAYRSLGRYTDALRDAERLMQILEKDKEHPDLVSIGLRMKGLSLFRLGQPALAIQLLERSLQLSAQIQDGKALPGAQIDLGMVYRAIGDYSRARDLYLQALNTLQQVGDLSWQSALLNNLGVLLLQQGEYEQAYHRLQEGMDLSRRNGDARTQALIHASLGDLYEEVEDYELAEQAHSETESYARQANVRFLLHYSLIAKARLARRTANLARAQSILDEIHMSIDQTDSNYEKSLYDLEWGRLQLYMQDYPAARRSLRRAADSFEQGGLTLERGTSLLWLIAASMQDPNSTVGREMNELDPILAQKQYFHPLGMTCLQVYEWLENSNSGENFRNKLEPYYQYATQARSGFPTTRSHIRKQSKSNTLQPSRLTINSLGKSQVFIQGRQVTNAQWKARAVRELFFFMFTSSRPMTKEKICAALWPELSTDQLRYRFKNYVYRLRNATDQNVLVYENENYAFNHGLSYVHDLDLFTAALTKAGETIDPVEQIRHYQTAVNLVRGRYLEDIDSTWVLPERERLGQVYLEALIALARRLFDIGDQTRAILVCQKAIAWDACFEEAHRLLMEIHAATGDRIAFARQYHVLQETLKKELGVTPSPETETLYRSKAP